MGGAGRGGQRVCEYPLAGRLDGKRQHKCSNEANLPR
jgi:hypothetical protein